MTQSAASAHSATVITVGAATGGCGKTFFATNLAYLLHHDSGRRVCIVDLDFQFGEVSTSLRLRPRFTISDVLQRELPSELEEFLVTHDTGVHVLAAPKDPSHAHRIRPPDITKIIEMLREKFDYVIIDTPSALTEIVLTAFDLSDYLFVIATLDQPSIRNTDGFLNTIRKLNMPAEKVRLILNKAETNVSLDIEQVTRLFPEGFQAMLPYARHAGRAVHMGMPILALSSRSEVSRRIEVALVHLLPEKAGVQIGESPERSRARMLFSRMARSR